MKSNYYLFVIIIFNVNLLLSQGFQVNLQGQKQQGMASAGSAFVQDESLLSSAQPARRAAKINP